MLAFHNSALNEERFAGCSRDCGCSDEGQDNSSSIATIQSSALFSIDQDLNIQSTEGPIFKNREDIMSFFKKSVLIIMFIAFTFATFITLRSVTKLGA